MSVLTFSEAVSLTIALVPGLKGDMQRLQELRKQKPKDMDGVGRIGLNIPNPLIPILKQYKPELYQSDKQLADRAWLRFIQSPESELFRVNSQL